MFKKIDQIIDELNTNVLVVTAVTTICLWLFGVGFTMLAIASLIITAGATQKEMAIEQGGVDGYCRSLKRLEMDIR